MKLEYYNPVDEKGSCVIRAISKALNKEFLLVKEELLNIGKNYNDVEVFESYLLKYGYIGDSGLENTMLFDNTFKGTNIVFMYDNDWYHMVAIIDNVIYDKCLIDELSNMKIIKIYKYTSNEEKTI